MSNDQSVKNSTNKTHEESTDAEDRSPIQKPHFLSSDDIEDKLKSDLKNGLSSSEAEDRLRHYGSNTLSATSRRSNFRIFIDQFKSLIVILLVIASGLAFLVNETIEGFSILVVIVINVIIGFFTELRAKQAITALQKQSVPTAHVIREGSEHRIEAADVVPGDLVILTAGERVPADGRIVESVQLQIQESALTGESLPISKTDDVLSSDDDDVPLGDRTNMAYMGTVITDGRGQMLITATGMSTEVGKIGTMIDDAVTQDSPLEQRLEQLGRALVVIVAGLCVIIVTAGVIRGEEPLSMLEVGIALAIAALPQGLPAVATMTLAIGVQRMAKSNALVRRLPAVETLGSTTVICTDKTGTLTKNEMTVTNIELYDDSVRVTGSGYELEGAFHLDDHSIDPDENANLMLALQIGTLCNDAELDQSEEHISIIGDPTEGAMIVVAEKAGLVHAELEKAYDRVDEVPFDSESKRMVTVHRTPENQLVAYMKGSTSAVLDCSTQVRSEGESRPLNDEDRDRILQLNHEMAQDALRVLAVAHRELPDDYTPDDLTAEFVYVGLIGMIDPLREEVKPAIEKCHEAGIRTIMITGDQPVTAAEIAEQLGLDQDHTGKRYQTVHANDLEKLDDEGWQQVVADAAVFARVSPEHKLRIVESLQAQNEIVAMTGDGVNDAPALRKADIGVAMGIKGTEVAKETADMIITDDNFATIERAVEQGRMIYSNILRFIHYLFSCNFSEIVTVFAAIMVGWPLPLAALQILWLNIITDVFPAMALALEPSAPDVMKQKPRDPQERLLNRQFALLIAWQGLLLAGVTLTAFAIGLSWYGTEGEGLRHAVTISFMTLALAQVFHAFNSRSQYETIFNNRLFANPWLWGAVALCLTLQFAAVYVPLLQTVLRTVPLELSDWGLVLASALAPVLIVELVKLGQRTVADRRQ